MQRQEPHSIIKPNMKKLNSLFLLLFLVISSYAQETEEVKKVAYPTGYSAQIDVVYAKVKDWNGRMDLYLTPKEKGPSPIVINIHGGGWNHGTKESQNGFNSFFKKGYAVANVEYRLVDVAPAPAAIEDVRCALIYIISHAQELNVDVNKIVIMGGSSGGHLALMGGLLANNTIFDTNCKSSKPIKVAAIVDKYGIADVWDWGYGKDLTSKSAIKWLGTKATDENFAKSVSPMSYVTKTSPPTFIVHGNADPTVPYQQSVKLYKAFQDAGVKSEFMTIEGGKHGGFPKEQNSELNAKIMEFLKGLGINN